MTFEVTYFLQNHYICKNITGMKNSFLKNSMNFGALCGLVIIILSLLLYLLSLTSTWFNSIVLFLVLIFFIFIGTKYYRDQYSNGIISYGRSVGSGVLISLFMSIVVAFYIFMFFKFIAPDELDKMIELQGKQLSDKGMSEEQIEMAIELAKRLTNPTTMALGTIFSYTFWGTTFSLIIAAFVKKSGKSQQQMMEEIEKDLINEN